MDQFELVAEMREASGKGAARRLRRAGMVPAVLYGDKKDAVALQLDANHVKRQLEHEAFFSHILTVKVDGKETQAVVKALQRDPATEQVTHMDLLRVSAKSEITMNVPLHFVNEESSPGKKAGGVISHLIVDVEVSCLPKDLPEYIEVDIGAMDIGDSLHLSELKVPPGVTLTAIAHDPEQDQTVVSVQHAQKFDLEEEEAAAEAEALEGEELEGEAAEAEGAEPEKPEEGEES